MRVGDGLVLTLIDGSSRERSDGVDAPLFHSVRLPCKASVPRCHGPWAPMLLASARVSSRLMSINLSHGCGYG